MICECSNPTRIACPKVLSIVIQTHNNTCDYHFAAQEFGSKISRRKRIIGISAQRFSYYICNQDGIVYFMPLLTTFPMNFHSNKRQATAVFVQLITFPLSAQ